MTQNDTICIKLMSKILATSKLSVFADRKETNTVFKIKTKLVESQSRIIFTKTARHITKIIKFW